VTAPRWLFRFIYDRESAAWERRRDRPGHRELVERSADELANVGAPPGPVADLGCGPGAHALALTRRGYDVVGLDGSPRMVEAARLVEDQGLTVVECHRGPGYVSVLARA
jgi:trans-aconitate methyltransferase